MKQEHSTQKLDMKLVIPATIVNCRNGNQYAVQIEDKGTIYYVWYETILHNKKGPVGKRRYETTFPKILQLTPDFFETMGLLQGEMSKTRREQLTFCNSEPKIILPVMNWFSECFLTSESVWRWYIKVNVPRSTLSEETIERVIQYWMERTPIEGKNALPTTVSCIEKTKNSRLANYGTLIIEKSSPLFSQTMQKLVRDITTSMPSRPDEDIISFMRGVIAAEACVNYRFDTGHRRIFITATNNSERQLFRACLTKLGITSYDCFKISDIVISQRENILKLDELGLMTLHPEKHARFKEMVASYTGTWHERRSLKVDKTVLTI